MRGEEGKGGSGGQGHKQINQSQEVKKGKPTTRIAHVLIIKLFPRQPKGPSVFLLRQGLAMLPCLSSHLHNVWITYSCSTHCRSLGKSPGHLARQPPLLNCSENLQQTPVRPRLCFKTQHDGLLPLEVSRLNLLGDGCGQRMHRSTVAPFL